MDYNLTYQQRIRALVQTKEKHAKIIRQYSRNKKLPFNGYTTLGALDTDDKGIIPAPPHFKFRVKPNHPSGGVLGPKACGENFRRLLEIHPAYIDPMSSLAGGWMISFWTVSNPNRCPNWNPDFDYSHLYEEQNKYGLLDGIGFTQHFSQDMTIGFTIGWRGILDKIRYYKRDNKLACADFYDGLEDVVLGVQNWIHRHVGVAKEKAAKEENSELRKNLITVAEINQRLVTEPPQTFHEAVQWLAWYFIVAVMYNGSGSVGAIDRFLKPYYDKDTAEGVLTDEEAMFHLACLLLKDNQYFQIGGTDEYGNDITNPISFLLLEAAHQLKIPTNICVRVHEKQDPMLLKKAVEYLFKDQKGSPNFISDKNINEGFMKNGYSITLARKREKTGCHWCAIPGREYTMNDLVKINFVAVFDVGLREMLRERGVTPTVEELWNRFKKHLRRAIDVIAEGIDFHLEHMHEVFPELVLDLLCHGPIEKGIDATHGGVDFYNMCVDGAGLATVADSFAAIEQRVEKEKRVTWKELMNYLDTDFRDAEDVRLMFRNIPRYGVGGSRADEYAIRISKTFAKMVKEKPTPHGYMMIPGIFSWANAVSFGAEMGATPNGRHAGQPISHGANPDPGFTGAEGATALATAVASVQTGYGNTVPLQIDIDPLIFIGEEGIEKFISFIYGYFDMGGTLLNSNIIDKKQILEAHEDPSKYPDLTVRVTGFTAYFAGLSKEWRNLVVDRIIESQ
jgi:pyruvate-formate lyase